MRVLVYLICGAITISFLSGCGKTEEVIKVPPSPVEELVSEADAFRTEGRLSDARDVYRQIIAEHPDSANIEQVQKNLYTLNLGLILSDAPSPKAISHEVVSGDTLGKIAQKYNVTIDLIRASNGIKGDVIRLGETLRVWTGKFSIFIDKSRNILMLKSDDEVVKVYSVSTGLNNSTPVGTFKVMTKLENPVWFKTGAVIPPESPDNVLGTRWMGFDLKGYGIHGTTHPDQIGMQVSAGCIRMLNADVEELYTLVPRGTEVTVVD